MNTTNKPMLIVQLDNNSLTTGTVIAQPLYFKEALRWLFDATKDGARIPGRRIWNGVAPVGAKVEALQL